MGAERRARLTAPRTAMHVSVVLLGLAVFLPAARREPDFHHDGVILAQAIGASEGLTVHSDVWSAYGPLTTWIQVPMIWAFGPNLLAIRMQGAVALALVAGLISILTYRFSSSAVAAVLTASLWIFTCPTWAVDEPMPPLLAWPSVYYALLVLASVWLMVQSTDRQESLAGPLAAASGVVVGVACFARLQLGVAHIIMTTVALLAVHLVGRDPAIPVNRIRVVLAAYVGGAVAAGLTVMGILAAQGAFGAFVNQSVIGPARYFPQLADPEDLLVVFGLVPAVVCVLVCSVLIVGASPEKGWRVWVVLVLAVALVAWLAVAWGVGRWWPILAPAASALLLLKSLWEAAGRAGGNAQLGARPVQLAVISAGGLAAWLQFVPLGDAMHVWWAAPLPLVAFAILVHDLAVKEWRVLLAGSVALTIGYCAVLHLQDAARPRSAIDGGVLDGMLLSDEYARSFAELQGFLARQDLSKAHVASLDGIFAVWNGVYTPGDGAYVDWAWGAERSDEPRHQLLRCSRNLDGLDAWARAQGARVVDQTGDLVIGYPIACAVLEREDPPFTSISEVPWWQSDYWGRDQAA